MSSNLKKSAPRRIDFDNASEGGTNSNVVSPTPSRRTSPTKRKLDYFISPAKVARKEVAFVTPGTPEAGQAKKNEEEFVPIHLYKNIEYKRQGEASLDERTKTTFALVQEHYDLPADLEANRIYGPKSGICFEELAIRAYSQNLLESKTGPSIMICTACATTGHRYEECPSLI